MSLISFLISSKEYLLDLHNWVQGSALNIAHKPVLGRIWAGEVNSEASQDLQCRASTSYFFPTFSYFFLFFFSKRAPRLNDLTFKIFKKKEGGGGGGHPGL